MEIPALWRFFLFGLGFSIAIETLVLLVGLSPRHSLGRRLFAGVWLTSCTYPIVALVMPMLFDLSTHYALYLWVAETFAPVAECALFWVAFGTQKEPGWKRMLAWDFAAIIVANLVSFGSGLLLDPYVRKWIPQEDEPPAIESPAEEPESFLFPRLRVGEQLANNADGAQLGPQGRPRDAEQITGLDLAALDVTQHRLQHHAIHGQGHLAIDVVLAIPQHLADQLAKVETDALRGRGS